VHNGKFYELRTRRKYDSATSNSIEFDGISPLGPHTNAMSKAKKSSIEVQGTAVAVLSDKNGDYISLTDMLRAKDGEFLSPTGSATGTPWSSSVFGSPCSTRLLITANSPQLKVRPA
jgi:hypothetical protein